MSKGDRGETMMLAEDQNRSIAFYTQWSDNPLDFPEEVACLGRKMDGTLFTNVTGDIPTAAKRVRRILLLVDGNHEVQCYIATDTDEVITVKKGRIEVVPALRATAPEFWDAVVRDGDRAAVEVQDGEVSPTG